MHQERGLQRERERESEEVERICLFFFKRKPTLVSLPPSLGAVEDRNLSPSLTPSAVTLAICLVYIVPFLLFCFPFEEFFFSSPLLSCVKQSVNVLVCLIVMCLPVLHMLFIYGALHVSWLIITAVIITYRHNCIMVNMTEWPPQRNAVSVVNVTEA